MIKEDKKCGGFYSGLPSELSACGVIPIMNPAGRFMLAVQSAGPGLKLKMRFRKKTIQIGIKMKDYKKQVVIDFEDFPGLFDNLSHFAKREYLTLSGALIRILAITVSSNFNLGDEPGDPWPFMPDNNNPLWEPIEK